MKNVALVIGGSSGIGQSVVLKLLSKGYIVHQISRHECLDPRVKNHLCDVINDNSLQKCIEEIRKSDEKIDVLVYSAGCSMAIPLEYTKKNEYRYLFEVNFFGMVEVIKQIVPIMRKGKKGRIILISSLGGSIPIAYDTFYSASKAAVNSLSFNLNLELRKQNIYVTSILPGGTRTGFTYKRKVVYQNNNEYRYLANAVKSLENFEQKGMHPEKVAKVVYRQIKKNKPNIIVVPGLVNKIMYLLAQILPKRWLFGVVKKAYHLE